MRRTRRVLLLAAAMVPLSATTHAATVVTYPFRAVTHYERTEPAGAVVPREVVINILEIDLTDPTIGLVLTPSNGDDPGEVNGQTTPEFVNEHAAQIGINGVHFSNVGTGPNGELYRTVNGIEVAAGVQVSPWSGGFPAEGGINFSSTNLPTLVRPPTTSYTGYNTVPSLTAWNLLGGRERLITGGVITAVSTAINPYTAIGYKGNTLYLFVVDGRQTGYSEGMTLVEIANFMQSEYGLTDLVSLDGGGSTTMVLADPTAHVVNSPSDGSERSVANNFGLYATLLRQRKVNANGNWSTSGNWTGGVPNAVGAAARFGSAITAPRTITLNLNAVAGMLEFDSANAYTIGGSNVLTLDASVGNAVVKINSGAHTFAAPMGVSDAVDFNVAAGASFAVNGVISNASGKTINKIGAGSLRLAGAQVHGAGTIINMNGGALTLDGPMSSSTVTLNLNGGLTDIGVPLNLVAVNVASGATANVEAGGANTLRTGTLSIAPGAELDLNDNDLVINSGNFATLQAKVLEGFGGITGITSSTSNGTQILALFDNALVGAVEWNGASIGPNALVGKYTYFGDLNFDGQVTGDDYGVVDANLNTAPAAGIAWLSGDSNLDGSVTGDDYGVIDANLGLGVGNPLGPSVPEPAGAALLALAGLLTRRCRFST